MHVKCPLIFCARLHNVFSYKILSAVKPPYSARELIFPEDGRRSDSRKNRERKRRENQSKRTLGLSSFRARAMPAVSIPISHKHVELWRRMLHCHDHCSLGDLCVILHLELLRRMLNCSFADRSRHLGYWIVPLHGELSSCILHYELECMNCDH